MTKTLQAIAGALAGDEKSRRIGWADAMLGVAWCCPAGADVVAYSLGYHEGEQERPRHAGETPAPERPQ